MLCFICGLCKFRVETKVCLRFAVYFFRLFEDIPLYWLPRLNDFLIRFYFFVLKIRKKKRRENVLWSVKAWNWNQILMKMKTKMFWILSSIILNQSQEIYCSYCYVVNFLTNSSMNRTEFRINERQFIVVYYKLGNNIISFNQSKLGKPPNVVVLVFIIRVHVYKIDLEQIK